MTLLHEKNMCTPRGLVLIIEMNLLSVHSNAAYSAPVFTFYFQNSSSVTVWSVTVYAELFTVTEEDGALR